MPNQSFKMRVREELELRPAQRPIGSGWLSGVLALVTSIASLCLVLALKFPALLTFPELSVLRDSAGFKPFTQGLLAAAYVFGLLNLILRNNKVLGIAALAIAIVAGLIGAGPSAQINGGSIGLFFGLDFFVINMLFTGFLFIPLERWLPRLQEQRLFRAEWREDLFYYLVSSMMVQVLTFLTMAPSNILLKIDSLKSIQLFFGALPWLLQLLMIMIFTDTVQYWLHRAFHRVPFLWGFHAVHHSAKAMDWMAGARMHFLEIIVLRSVTAIPMFTLGFDPSALQAYVLVVYIYSSFIHANVGFDLNKVGNWLVTPRFHHWHHGIDAEAIDVNFAIHFPWLDRLFGTLYWPKQAWPSGYGIKDHPVPRGYLSQLQYPFRARHE